MNRVFESWSPNNADIVLSRQRDASVVEQAFVYAISQGSESSQELFERRLRPQFDSNNAAPSGLWFDDAEAPIVVDALATFARNLPETNRNFIVRRRTESLIGAIAIVARHDYTAV